MYNVVFISQLSSSWWAYFFTLARAKLAVSSLAKHVLTPSPSNISIFSGHFWKDKHDYRAVGLLIKCITNDKDLNLTSVRRTLKQQDLPSSLGLVCVINTSGVSVKQWFTWNIYATSQWIARALQNSLQSWLIWLIDNTAESKHATEDLFNTKV